MSLHEDMENQGSGTGFMLEVPEVNIPEFIGADGKDEIVPVMYEPENTVTKQDQVVRSRKMTEKGCQFKISTLLEDISRINKRMIRKSGAINDLLYSTKNSVTVEEELAQFDDLFKQLMKVHNEYLSIEVNGNEKGKQNQWFDEVDECVLSFKHKVHNWLKDVALEEEKASRHFSKRSSKSSGHSKKSSRSSRLSSSGSSKERAAVEKAKLTELMMEAEFLEKKQIIQNQAEKLKIEEKLAKAQARSQIFAGMKSDHSLRGSLMSLSEDDQHHERKPPVIDDQNNRSYLMLQILKLGY